MRRKGGGMVDSAWAAQLGAMSQRSQSHAVSSKQTTPSHKSSLSMYTSTKLRIKGRVRGQKPCRQ